MDRSKDSGFSLIEALVALTVLAVSSSVLLSTTEGHTRSIKGISDRLVARWIAENRLVELTFPKAELPSVVQMAGSDWWVRTEFSETTDPDLRRADVSVGPMSSSEATLARLTGFLDVAGRAL